MQPNNNPFVDKTLSRLYAQAGAAEPFHQDHEFEPERDMVKFKATKWWLEGNVLHADGNHGHVAQTIPTDYICMGIDATGLPILKKIVL